MTPQHNNLAAGRFFTLTLAEQLGNVGSEVERAISWHERGQKEYFEKAFARMLELLDLTLSDPRWKFQRLRELARVREVICDSFEGAKEYGVPFSYWKKYFFDFALLARAGR